MNHYQVAVIGAGINGAGIARDLALRGIRCALIDKADLCNGTSAWSTRLVHGGLRYLEYAEVDLVRESLREREILLHQAPHLVHPLPLMIPIYQGARRGPLLIWAGMLAYDLLSWDKSLPWHRMLSARETLRRSPGLRSERLRGSAVYYDAQVEFAERLVLENVVDAHRHGCDLYLYHEVVDLQAGKITVQQDGRSREIGFDVCINVTGPWVDDLLQRCHREFPRQMGGTKGSHIVVDRFAGLPQEALYVEASADGRPYFIVPWNDQLLIGTTDLRTEEDLDRVQASRAECQYLLEETNKLYPQAGLGFEHIHFTYSGVRPLPYTPKGSTASITRRHQVVEHKEAGFPLYSVVGGKLTTYRSLAEEACNKVLKRLGTGPRPCRTRRRPLPGQALLHEETFSKLFAERHGLSESTGRHLTRTYGAWAEEIAVLARQDEVLRTVICSQTGAIAAEVVWSCRHEHVRHVDDFLLRRSLIGWRAGQALAALPAVIRWMALELGWDAARQEKEAERYREVVRRFQVPGA